MNRQKTIFDYIVIYFFLLLMQLPIIALAYDLPEMGDSAVRSLSRAQEQQLGAQIMLQVRESTLYNTDPIVTGYVQSLGERLVMSNERETDDFEFFVINDPRVNAFALPGGYIGINAGLILVAEREDEVAGVMAHEMAHVTQRHIARMFERSQSLSWPMMAVLLGSMILASQSPALGAGAIASAMAGSTQDMINFTRSNEEEADRIGMDLLVNAAFDPNAMSTFFGRMAQANKYNESFYVPDFLRTHPVNSARIADAATRAQQYPAVAKNDSLRFVLIKQRLQVIFSKHNQDLLTYYRSELAKPENNTNSALHYGYSLALARKGFFKEAIGELQQLIKNNEDEKIYYQSLAEIYHEQHQYTEGIALLQNILKTYPRDEGISLQLGQMMLNAKQYQQAKTLMEQQIRFAREHIQYYHYLAQAQSELGDPQESHMSRAEYYALQNDLHSAVRELKRAQTFEKDNHYQQAKISARLKEIEAELEFLDL